jgi:hypothetical protein
MDSSSASKPHTERHADNRITVRNVLMFVGLLVSMTSVILAYRALNASTAAQVGSTATQRQLKEIDLRQSFQKRYDDLSDDLKLKVKSRQDAETYYRRYWRLQLEEYQYWCEGMIDEKLYDTWANSRRYEWNTNVPLNYKGGAYLYREGWDAMKKYLNVRNQGNSAPYENFMKFFDNTIFRSKDTNLKPRDHCS